MVKQISKSKRRKNNRDKIREKRELIAKHVVYYRQRPDVFCEEVLELKLNIYQKVAIRAFFKKKYLMLIWSRGLGK